MDKKTAGKVGVGSVGAGLIALSLIFGSLSNTVDVDGRYTIENSTSHTKTFIAEDIDSVPEATFYDLVITSKEGDTVLGKSNFGGTGIVSANIVFKPVDNLSVIIYDSNLNEIGVGELKENGEVTYKIKEELITSEKSSEK